MTRSRGCGSSSSPSGCSCPWPVRCWPTGAPTSCGSSASRAIRTARWRRRASAPTAAASTCRWRWPTGASAPSPSTCRTRRGLQVLHELLESADVLLTSLRPGALSRLGLDAETVRERYPSLVYARGNGFGVRGPDANAAGYDASAFFARGGLAHVLTPPERDYPIAQRGAMGDRNGAIGAGLRDRRRSAEEGSNRQGARSSTCRCWPLPCGRCRQTCSQPSTADQVTRVPGRGPQPNPVVGSYRTADGRHIQLVFLESDRYWPDFCRTIGRDDLIDDPRFVDLAARRENSRACVAELDAVFATRTFEEWKELLALTGCPVGAGAGRRGAGRRPSGGGQRLLR